MALENSMLVIDGKQVGGDTEDLTAYQTKTDNTLQTNSKQIPGAINELNSKFTDMGNYSTSEVNTGMKWTDGRNIFRKVISCGALPDTNQKIQSSGLSNVTVIDIHGIAISASDTVPLPHASSANKNTQLHYSSTINSVIIITTDDYSSYTESYVTLLYVKNQNP